MIVNHKKIVSIRYIIIFLSTFFTISIYSNTELLIDDSLNLYDDVWNTDSSLVPTQVKTIDPEEVILLLKVSGALALLEEDFFNRTNDINVESLLDMAVYNNLIMYTPKERLWSCGFFYNQTSEVKLTRNSSDIGSYLNLASDSILTKISNIFEETKELLGDNFLSIDVPGVLCAIAKGKIQWRRTGLMFYGVHQWKNMVARLYLPFYYIERNFFLNNAELDQLEKSLGVTIDRNVSIFNMDPFVRDHFIGDKLGLGDLRISLENEIFESELYQYLINAGVYMTLPTACVFSEGLLGRSFNSPYYLPNIDFNALFDLGTDYFNEPDPIKKALISQKSTEVLRTILFDLFDRMAGALLMPQLGNGGHVGIGGFLRTSTPLSILIKHPFATNVIMSSKLGLEYLFPSYEKRFFITNKDIAGFASRDFDDDSKAAENLAFIEQEILNRFFLLARKTCVHPGIIFTWTSKLMYEGTHWGLIVGSDTWLRTRESFSEPVCPPCISSSFNSSLGLDVKKNKPFMAYRSSIFGGVRYAWESCEYSDTRWILSFNGDVAVSTTGIGEDFSLFLKIEKEF